MKTSDARVAYVMLASSVLATCLPIGLAQSVAQPNSKLSKLPGSSFELENRLYVEMFDYARLSHRTRQQAEQVTSGIFARAGVSLFWIDCTVGEKLQQGPECNGPLGPARPGVRILPRIRVAKSMPIDAAVGYTAGNMTTISLEWAEVESGEDLASVPDLLGCAIAHELGHILLGPNSHSVSGLMRARWDTRELQAAGQHFLSFAPEEAATIRAEIMARAGPPSAPAMARATLPTKLGGKPPASRKSAADAEIAQDRR